MVRAHTRLTRAESKARTRDELVAAARTVFLDRGYHGASLEAVAAAAGFSTGAVYSAFRGKADLFLAVLDAHLDDRIRQMELVSAAAPSVPEHAEQLARQFATVSSHERGWAPVVIEFWAHASRDAQLRAEFARRHERLKSAIARLIEQTLARSGQRLVLDIDRVATAAAALGNGLTLERLVEPGGTTDEEFADLASSIMKGLIR